MSGTKGKFSQSFCTGCAACPAQPAAVRVQPAAQWALQGQAGLPQPAGHPGGAPVAPHRAGQRPPTDESRPPQDGLHSAEPGGRKSENPFLFFLFLLFPFLSGGVFRWIQGSAPAYLNHTLQSQVQLMF